jgi:lipopolysaccharide export system protein LptC
VNKKTLFLTVILLVVFSTISIVAVRVAKKITTSRTNNANTPDFLINHAVYVQFDKNGNISNKFHTDKIIHFTDHNNYVFENPSIKLHNPDEQPWSITANKGRSVEGKSKIYLWDNVKVTQTSGENNPSFDISTEALTFYLDIKFAETNEPITVIQSGSVIKAMGAKANFKSGIVELLSDVECQYQPS